LQAIGKNNFLSKDTNVKETNREFVLLITVSVQCQEMLSILVWRKGKKSSALTYHHIKMSKELQFG